MWVLILFTLVIPCAGLAAVYYLEYWRWNIRMADEKAKEGVK